MVFQSAGGEGSIAWDAEAGLAEGAVATSEPQPATNTARRDSEAAWTSFNLRLAFPAMAEAT